MTLADQAARDRIRTDFGTTLVVEAAAGTGKTTELVARIIGLLRSGEAELDRMVITTFTEKAAGELKLRLRTELERARTEAAGEAASRLDAAMQALEIAHVSTIHGFCAELLRERPVEARVDPAFEVLTERAADALLDQALDAWYEAALAEPPEPLRRLLRKPGWKASYGPRDALRGALRRLAETRDFPARWSRSPFDRDARIDSWVKQARELATYAGKASSATNTLAANLRALQRWCKGLDEAEAVRARDYDVLEHRAARLLRQKSIWQHKGKGTWYGDGIRRTDVLDLRNDFQERLRVFVEDAEADLAAGLQHELLHVVADYGERVARAGALDFLDLLIAVRDLLRDDQATRVGLQDRYTHLFVDEFQDTDPLQAEILLLLASASPAETNFRRVTPRPGKLFVVGDPKQAIYRFRRADVTLYRSIKEHLLDHGAALLELSTSFRALPAIQGAVNGAFEDEMPGHFRPGVQCDYVALDPHREARDDQPAVIALPVPDPYGTRHISTTAIAASEPHAVAAFIDWLLHESGWKVAGKNDEEPRPVGSRDICLLFRRMQSFGRDVTRPYLRAIEARQIPHVLSGGRAFYESEEVAALGVALTAIEWPRDELSVYGTLKGPFFSLSDTSLLRFRKLHGRLSPLRWNEVEQVAEEDRRVAEALAHLRALHVRRNRRPFAATVGALLRTTRAHAAVAFWHNGDQALGNLVRCMDEARLLETAGIPSFRAFVEDFTAQQDGTRSRAVTAAEDADGIRMMTVHGAKGLEFPVVILCDGTGGGTRTTADRYVDQDGKLWVSRVCGMTPREILDHTGDIVEEDNAEEARILYVAATRARDLLVVPVVGDERPNTGWVTLLHESLYPTRDRWRRSTLAPGCPAFGEDSVKSRPPTTKRLPHQSVQPGLHAEAGDGHGVTWWDPHLLRLEVPDAPPLRQAEWVDVDTPSPEAARYAEEHDAWEATLERARETGGKPAVIARSVTAVAADAERDTTRTATSNVEVIEVPGRDPSRPCGPRFGTLVHGILERVPLTASSDIVHDLAVLVGRLTASTEPEIAAAALAVNATLAHPLLRAAAKEGTTRLREAPMILCSEDGEIIEGVVDLAYCGAGASTWTVIDFKSDLSGVDKAQYRQQVALYAEAVSTATGRPARGVLFAV